MTKEAFTTGIALAAMMSDPELDPVAFASNLLEAAEKATGNKLDFSLPGDQEVIIHVAEHYEEIACALRQLVEKKASEPS